eukprot:9488409-Pyramimonas_sp.AAC.1
MNSSGKRRSWLSGRTCERSNQLHNRKHGARYPQVRLRRRLANVVHADAEGVMALGTPAHDASKR